MKKLFVFMMIMTNICFAGKGDLAKDLKELIEFQRNCKRLTLETSFGENYIETDWGLLSWRNLAEAVIEWNDPNEISQLRLSMGAANLIGVNINIWGQSKEDARRKYGHPDNIRNAYIDSTCEENCQMMLALSYKKVVPGFHIELGFIYGKLYSIEIIEDFREE